MLYKLDKTKTKGIVVVGGDVEGDKGMGFDY